VTEDMRQDVPETGETVSHDYVEGLIMRENRIIGIISIPAILPEAVLAGYERAPEMVA